MPMGQRRRLLRSFGNPTLRAHLVWVVLATTGAMLLLGGAVVFVPLLVRFDGASSGELAALTDRILTLHETLWPFLGLCILAVFLSSWLILHRMVSPLVRYVRAFEAVRDGVLPAAVTLRATDYLTEETQAFNEMLASLRERQATLERIGRELADGTDELAAWTSAHGDGPLAALVERLREGEKALSSELVRVRIG